MGRKLKCQLRIVCLKESMERKCYRRSEDIAVASRWLGRENVTEKVKPQAGLEELERLS